MTTPPPSPNPLGDAAAKEDQVGLASRSMAAGFSLATTLLAIVAWLTARAVMASGITTKEELTPDLLQVNLMVYGTVFAVFTTGLFTWLLLSPVESNFRRGGLAITTAFAGFAIGALLTQFVHSGLGATGLLALVPIAAVATFWWFRAARKAAGK